jgi:hypothetical protein
LISVQSPRSIILLILLAGAACPTRGQTGEGVHEKFFDVTVGLGINAHFAHPVANYINLIAKPRQDQRIDIITSAPEFFGVAELQLSDEWSVGIEYSLLLKSHSVDDQSGYARSEIAYQVHMPTILVHRLIFGDGYRVKVGGGIGYSFCSFRQQFQPYGTEEVFRTAGPGFKLEAVGNTKFDETFYGSIGIDLRWDFPGTLEETGAAPAGGRIIGLPSMDFFNAGIKFGVTFQLN